MRDEGLRTPLHVAAAQSNADMIALLIHYDADLNAADKAGWTPLMHACFCTNLDAVELLLAETVDRSARNFDGQLALHVAAMGGSITVVQLLLDSEFGIDEQDENGQTALQIAAAWNHDELGIYLLASGATSNIQDVRGDQCAHTAAYTNCIELMKVLIDYDDHIGRKNFQGLTPLGICRLQRHHEIERILLDYFQHTDQPSGEVDTDRFATVDTARLEQWSQQLELPMTRTAQPLALRVDIDSSSYHDEALSVRSEIEHMRKLHRLAVVVQARVRRKLAWNEAQRCV
jgi:hypothetical protein